MATSVATARTIFRATRPDTPTFDNGRGHERREDDNKRDGDSVHEHRRAPRDDEPSKWPDGNTPTAQTQARLLRRHIAVELARTL